MTASDLTPGERVRRVKAALAEAGWPSANVFAGAHPKVSDVVAVYVSASIPVEIIWRAYFVAGIHLSCWRCWCDSGYTSDGSCTHDPLTSEWPPVPSPSDNWEAE